MAQPWEGQRPGRRAAVQRTKTKRDKTLESGVQVLGDLQASLLLRFLLQREPLVSTRRLASGRHGEL